MDNVSTKNSDIAKLNESTNNGDDRKRNQNEVVDRKRKRHKRSGHKERRHIRKHSKKYSKTEIVEEGYSKESNDDAANPIPKEKQVLIQNVLKNKHKKSQFPQVEVGAKRKKKRKHKDHKTNAPTDMSVIINTSNTDPEKSNDRQSDSVKSPSSKRLKTSNHFSKSCSTTSNAPSDIDASDVIHAEWRISKEKMKDLEEKGISVMNGKWTREENELIEANINRYMKEYGIQDREKLLFCNRKDAPTSKAEMYRYFAQGICRELHAAYRHILRIYHPSYGKPISSEEMVQLHSLYAIHGNDWKTIAKAIGQSNIWVEHKIRYLEQKSMACNTGKWSKDEDNKLRSIVLKHTENNSGPCRIPWSQVAKDLGTRNANQCRSRWLFSNQNATNCDNNGKVRKWGYFDTAKLIFRISELNRTSENDIDWATIAKNWPWSCTSEALAFKWTRIRAKVPKDNQRNLTEILNWLRESDYLKSIHSKVGSNMQKL
ncbi:uncharacterized protein TRIADDRAFT_53144 [Trichoplax adhaerens]|uniref:Myb-like domain-containing protein n=1 Tax=Trichoplax adhaerens TaxID=10228 RepID=B3RNF2_TRIAD|nr:hypothetical protein TRIADDRAFT_53144 [Trichoplax adhaerens]EDV28011.1 hypothetical protein TRIADDRAFT_53144 [Trichoplax adhaerens]|eukprot:XP_002109845.1 hypothetical protein TRIADDRAFT_53144 [Trichoplax adhaerens]